MRRTNPRKGCEDVRILQIAGRLQKRFLEEAEDSTEISIFLCGGSRKQQDKFRRQLGKRISGITSKYRYSVYYPEDLFVELMLGPQKRDLLSLENLLADSTNAVVILLQSPGTFTELGAFSNHERLREKLIVVIDPKFQRARSFINLGPVRYLNTKTKSRILYLPMDLDHLEEVAQQVVEAARDVSKNVPSVRDLANPISASRFYLALIYVFDPIPKQAFLGISAELADVERPAVLAAAETVLHRLFADRKIFLNPACLSTTPKGAQDLIYGHERKKRASEVLAFLTEARLQALNITLRKRPERCWGEAR